MKKIFLLSIFIYLFLSLPAAYCAGSDKIEDIPSSLDTPEINYNRGVINYRKNDFEKAAGLFNRALISVDKNLEAKASYNLGNCEYKLGKSKEKENPAETVKLLHEAMQYYKRSIELVQKNNDAKFNYEWTEKELKVLEDKLRSQKPEARNQKDEGRGMRDEEKNQEEQSAEAQQKKEQEEKQQESQAPEPSQGKENQPYKQEEQAKDSSEQKDMSKEEASILLEGYRQEENALGEVKEKRKARPSEVLKDW